MRPLNIPVVLGTTRHGRHSLHVARVMAAQLAERPGVETRLIDIATLALPVDAPAKPSRTPRLRPRCATRTASFWSCPSTTTASRGC